MEIRELQHKDLHFLNKVRNESVEFLHTKQKYTLEETSDWFKTLKNPYFMLFIKNKPIGYFRTSNWINDSIYIGMDIAKEHRGNGYAIPAYKKMIEKLKDEYQIKNIFLEVLESNKRAIHIYKKLGFEIIEKIPYTQNELSIKMKLKNEN